MELGGEKKKKKLQLLCVGLFRKELWLWAVMAGKTQETSTIKATRSGKKKTQHGFPGGGGVEGTPRDQRANQAVGEMQQDAALLRDNWN